MMLNTNVFATALLMFVAGCGADGAPVAPQSAAKAGFSVSADAQVGVLVQNP